MDKSHTIGKLGSESTDGSLRPTPVNQSLPIKTDGFNLGAIPLLSQPMYGIMFACNGRECDQYHRTDDESE